MDKSFNDYFDYDGKFNKDMYYMDVIAGANKAFTELFGNLTYSQMDKMILSYELDTLQDNIFKKSPFGWIYFIEDKVRKLIKVGMTQNIPKRISQLKTNYKFCGIESDFKIIALCASTCNLRDIESFFHEKFSMYHSYMEWYQINGEELLKMLSGYIRKNNLYNCYVDNVLIFHMLAKQWDNNLYVSNFTSEMPRKRLDPFYKNRLISIAESCKMDNWYNKIYDMFQYEIEQMYLDGNELNSKSIVNSIKKKYSSFNLMFYKKVIEDKNILCHV